MAQLEQLLYRINNLESEEGSDLRLIPLYLRVLSMVKDVDLRNMTAFNLSWAYCAVGNHREATHTLRKLVDLGYSPPEVYQNLSRCFSHMDNEERAIAVGDEGLHKYPAVPALHEVVGDAKWRMEDYRGAIVSYHMALDAGPRRDSLPGIYTFTVDCYKELDEWNMARKLCWQWLLEFPMDPVAMFELAESMHFCCMTMECVVFIGQILHKDDDGRQATLFRPEQEENLEFLKCQCYYRLCLYEDMREITTRYLRSNLDGPQISPTNRWYKMHMRVLFLSRSGISHEQAFGMLNKALHSPIDDEAKRSYLKKAAFSLVLLPNSIISIAKSKLISTYTQFLQSHPGSALVSDMLRVFAILDLAVGDIGFVVHNLRGLARRGDRAGEAYQAIRAIGELKQRLRVPVERVVFNRTWADKYRPPWKRLKTPKREPDPDRMDESVFADAPIPLSGKELRRALIIPPPPRLPFQDAYFFAFDRSSLPEALKELVTRAYRLCA